jgi:hypothetical protein
MVSETLYSAPDKQLKQLKQLIKEILSNPNIKLTPSGDLSYSAELAIDELVYNIVNNQL